MCLVRAVCPMRIPCRDTDINNVRVMSRMSERRPVDLDRDRVTVLLLINSLLIKKAYHIYSSVLSNQQAIQQLLPQSRQEVLEQYNNLNRRLQCNLSVLTYISDVYHDKAAALQPNKMQFPVILSAPPEMPELRQLYKRLQDLYPDAIQFLKMKMQQMKLQQENQARTGQQLPQTLQQAKPQHVGQGMPPLMQQIQQQMPMQQRHPQQAVPQQAVPQQPSYSQFNMNQQRTSQQFNSPQINLLQQQRAPPPVNAAPKTQMQTQPQKSMDMFSFNAGISPQMVSNEAEMPSFGSIDPSSFAGNFLNVNNVDKNVNAMLSISPQQILQQQGGNNDFNLDLY